MERGGAGSLTDLLTNEGWSPLPDGAPVPATSGWHNRDRGEDAQDPEADFQRESPKVNLGNRYHEEAAFLFQLEREGSLRYTEISQGHLLITLAFNYLSLICYMTLSKSFTLCVCIYL